MTRLLSGLVELGERVTRGFLLRQLPRDGLGAEIGVYKGGFSSRILRVARPRELHLIDPWKYEPGPAYRRSWYGGRLGEGQERMDRLYRQVCARFSTDTKGGRVHIHRCTSLEAARVFPDAFFDWVYIDGNHLYEFVRQDLESYLPKLKPGGLIAGDDYGVRGWWENGVQRAVDEFVVRPDCEWVLLHRNQFLMRKSRSVLPRSGVNPP